MLDIISENTLLDELNHFRYILNHYDFTEIKNVVFFDIESLNCYLKTYTDNPFERQYREIESILNKLAPYLPSDISESTVDVLSEILNSKNYDTKIMRDHLLFNLKLDFIERVKCIETEDEWCILLETCKRIRTEKESTQQREKVYD